VGALRRARNQQLTLVTMAAVVSGEVLRRSRSMPRSDKTLFLSGALPFRPMDRTAVLCRGMVTYEVIVFQYEVSVEAG
jgi:hypothetical protein